MQMMKSYDSDTPTKKGKNTNPSKLGRKGDPRMHAAVKARLTDPGIELITALENGGFVFTKNANGLVVDADNVSLNQRKNQLSRRVRLFKKRVKDEENLMEGNGLSADCLTDPAITSTNTKRVWKKDTQAPVCITKRPWLRENSGAPVCVPATGGDLEDSASAHTGKKRKLPTQHSPVDAQETAVEKNPKLEKALDEFRIGIASLFKKTMINAGYNSSQMDECDEAYLTFVETALEGELKRILRIKNKLYSPPTTAAIDSANEPLRVYDQSHNGGQDRRSYNNNKTKNDSAADRNHTSNQNRSQNFNQPLNEQSHSRNRQYDHQSSNNQDEQSRSRNDHQDHRNHQNSNNKDEHSNCRHDHHDHYNYNHIDLNNPMHLHRLGEECGHKAIVHRPANGKPHIDFVVNGTVECYEGYNPKIGHATYWPSTLAQESNPSSAKTNANSQAGDKRNKGGDKGNKVPSRIIEHDPILFDMKDVDFECGEWESILCGTDSADIGDEVLDGLFTLRSSKKTGV